LFRSHDRAHQRREPSRLAPSARSGFPAADPADGEIRIGIFGAFTGVSAEIANQMGNGSLLAIEQANAEGIVLQGKRYRIRPVMLDYEGKPEVGLSVTEKALNVDKIDMAVGFIWSHVFLRVQDMFQDAKVPVINAGSTLGYTGTMKKKLDYVFQISPRSSDIAQAVAEAVNFHLKPQRVAFLNENTDGGRAFGSFFVDWFKKNAPGTAIVYNEYVPQGTTDFTAELTKIKASKADVIIGEVLGAASSAFVTQWQQLKVPAVMVSMGGTQGQADFLNQHKKEMQGAIVNNRWWPGKFSAVSEPMYAQYRKRFGQDPTSFSVQGYDAALVAIQAIRTAGSLDRQKVRDTLATQTVQTVWGARKFTPVSEGQTAPVEMVVVQIQDGKKVPIWPTSLMKDEKAKFIAPPPWAWQ
jgi:branched-chain amino acid transport system substrate-binding protein